MIQRCILFALCASVQGYALREGVTPVQKVIQLLQDMAAKGKAEKHDEATKFSAYKQFCDDTSEMKQKAIAEANAQIEQLQADIQKAESDAAVLAEKIGKLDAQIAGIDVSAPQANAYEFQSSGVVDMLEKLKDKFEDERTDLEKEESNARHAYEMLIQDLTAQIETATEDREAKAQEKAS